MKHHNYYILIIFLLFFKTNFAQKAYFQQKVNTQISVTLDDANNFLYGTENIDYYNNSPDTLHYIYFHLWPNAYANDRTAYTQQAVENKDTKFYFSKEKDKGFIDSLNFEVEGIKAGMALTDNIDIVKIILPAPLYPNEKIQITTPFRVKIPYTFSRMGHVGQSYQISQWFPKPAVYDNKGWHPIPYLDQGEFYSEYGNYDVSITLPQNYIVMATGDLQNNDEVQWLDSLSKLPVLADSLITDSVPPSSNVMKTIRYTENNVHDFAWFADKTWVVRKDTFTIPQNGNTITAYTAFYPKHATGWAKGTQSLITTVRELSKRVGPYPYKTIKAVEGPLSAGGGMEYPTVTIISPSNSQEYNHTVIVHEAGHNWFYGLLGNNERRYPWMDEGINSYYEQIITHLNIQSDTNSNPTKPGVHVSKREILLTANSNIEDLSFSYPMSIRQDIASGAASDTFPSINYGGDVYNKTPYLLRWLNAYMGKDSFDAAMHDYFNQYQFKHPYPEDFQRVFQKHTTKDISWFLKVLNSNEPIDFAIKKVTKDKGFTNVSIKSKSSITAPVFVTLKGIDEEGNQLVEHGWVDNVGNTIKIFKTNIPNATWKKIAIGTHLNTEPNALTYESSTIDGLIIPDYDLRNNVNKKQYKLKGFLGLNNDYTYKTWLSPSLGYNYYDGFMLGALVHNISVPQNKFQYIIAPMFAFGSKTLAGTGQIGYTSYIPKGWLHDIQWNLQAKTFSYNKNSLNIDHYLHARYIKIAPEIILNIRKPNARSSVERSLSFKGYFIKEQQLAYNQDPIDSLYRPSKGGYEQHLYARVKYTHNNHRTFNPFSYNFEGQIGKDFAKITAEGNLKIDYFKQGKAMYVRVFGGKFFNFDNNIYQSSRYWLTTTSSGINDYLYDNTFLGRNEATGLVSQQIAMNEGGFKMRTQQYANPIGMSSSWLFAMNLSTDLPFGKIPLRAYASIATFTDARKLNPSGAQALFETGLEIHLSNYLSIYLPVFTSKDYKDYREQVLGKNSYWKTVSFSLNLNNIDWFNLPKMLLRNITL